MDAGLLVRPSSSSPSSCFHHCRKLKQQYLRSTFHPSVKLGFRFVGGGASSRKTLPCIFLARPLNLVDTQTHTHTLSHTLQCGIPPKLRLCCREKTRSFVFVLTYMMRSPSPGASLPQNRSCTRLRLFWFAD
jgi:hypothetical protein